MAEILTLEFVNSIWSFQLFVVPLHSMMSHEAGGGSESGALLGNLWQNIELRTVSISQPQNFSILCNAFIQRNPAISSKVTKKRASKFGEAKVTEKREKSQRKPRISFHS